LARQDKHAEALRAVKEVERRGDADLPASLRTSLLYEKAWSLRETGQVGEAAAAYRALLESEPDGEPKAYALLDLAGIEADAGRYESAGQLLQRLRELLGGGLSDVPAEVRERAAYRLAVCEFELGRFQEAGDLFAEFIEAFPKSELLASASAFCGEALLRVGRHERAVKHLRRVVEHHSDDPAYAASLLRLGDCLAVLQRWAESEKVFERYLDCFGDSEHWFQAQFGVGWARENQGRYDEAIQAYEEVAKRHRGPTAARAQFQIGECLFAKGQHRDAVRELLKVDVLYGYPEWSAAALFEAGRCFAAMNMPGEARAHFEQVSQNHGETRWGRMASQQLAELSAPTLPGH
jgi:TolA-binding protein